MAFSDLIPWGRDRNQPSGRRNEDDNPLMSLQRDLNRVFEGVSTRPSSAPWPTTFVTCWRSDCGVRPSLRRMSAARPSPSSASPISRCSGPT